VQSIRSLVGLHEHEYIHGSSDSVQATPNGMAVEFVTFSQCNNLSFASSFPVSKWPCVLVDFKFLGGEYKTI
jgi:hypothetical protein